MTYAIQVGAQFFDFAHPESHEYNLHDAVHALSHIARFSGHTRFHYSVAQHCLLVATLAPPEFKYEALMHDLAEAYTGDIPTPMKRLLRVEAPVYMRLVKGIETAVANYFRFPVEMSHEVHQADLCAMMTERRDLLHVAHDEHWPDVEPSAWHIYQMSPEEAERLWWEAYEEYKPC